jgi:hypothetical protein
MILEKFLQTGEIKSRLATKRSLQFSAALKSSKA